MRRDLGLDPPERRIGLSAHDFAQALGAPEVILVARRQSRRRADRDVAFRAAHRRARRRDALERGAQARQRLSRLRPRARSSGAGQSRRRARRRRRRSRRGRRGCRSPPSRTGCATPTRSTPTIFCACSRSTPSTRRPARATAAPSFTAPSAISPQMFAAEPAGRSDGGIAARSAKSASRRWPTIPEARAFWWPRFLRIAHWFARGMRERRDGIAALHAEINGELKFPDRASASSRLRPSPTASSSAATAATPSSTTRPARRAPKSRCARGWRRN